MPESNSNSPFYVGKKTYAQKYWYRDSSFGIAGHAELAGLAALRWFLPLGCVTLQAEVMQQPRAVKSRSPAHSARTSCFQQRPFTKHQTLTKSLFSANCWHSNARIMNSDGIGMLILPGQSQSHMKIQHLYMME